MTAKNKPPNQEILEEIKDTLIGYNLKDKEKQKDLERIAKEALEAGFLKQEEYDVLKHRYPFPGEEYKNYTILRKELHISSGKVDWINVTGLQHIIEYLEQVFNKKERGLPKITKKPSGYWTPEAMKKEVLGEEPARKPNGYWKNPENILNEAQELLEKNNLKQLPPLRQIIKLRSTTLSWAISQNYPGGSRGLRETLGEIVKTKPSNYWKKPQHILEEAQRFMQQHNLSELPPAAFLSHHGAKSLSGAISNYPGKSFGLRKDLGEKPIKKIVYSTKDTIKEEIIKFMKENNMDDIPTTDELNKFGRNDLAHAIYQKYPGKLRGLRKDLGREQLKKLDGYWTPETVRQETINFLKQHQLTQIPPQSKIEELKRGDLAQAISLYPGKIHQLRKDLGQQEIKKPNGYWKNPENIRQEMQQFMEQYHFQQLPPAREIINLGRPDLVGGIIKYPGKFSALRRDLAKRLNQTNPVDTTIEELMAEYSRKDDK